MKEMYDFSGWATRNDIKCSDGRTIRRDAFIGDDGLVVPLVWNHQHNEAENVLGHALLENRPDGVYTYGKFNDTEAGMTAKALVSHGDVTHLSIYANQLKHNGSDVIHGAIREVSLVLAGANPGACIDTVIAHGDGSDEEAYIFTDESISLEHADSINTEKTKMEKTNKTMADVYNEMTDEQKLVVKALVAEAVAVGRDDNSEDNDYSDKETEDMKHNVFYNDETDSDNYLSHSDMMAVIDDARRFGSLKESALQHGIEDVTMLFPDDHGDGGAPKFLNDYEGTWIAEVMNGVHKSPFSRLKSLWADISDDDARAKGFLPDRTHRDEFGNLIDADGNRVMKKEEVFSLLKRTTSPTTVYKKQRMDRDDLNDIIDFDVVSWIKHEMRMKLDEELARAFLIGDGRLSSSDDKINETNIRPIWTDEALYTINQVITVGENATVDDKAAAMIDNAVLGRIKYKGAGNPVLFTTETWLANMLLLKDLNGRRIYNNENDLATAMRVRKIVTCPYFDNRTRTVTTTTGSEVRELAGIIVNLSDYTVGADRGGEVSMFDDFDIDYNAQKYLIETRCSGSLMTPYSAITLEFVEA